MKKDIYIIINKINNKIYIGQSVNYRNRWLKHVSDSNKKNKKSLIDRSIKKYGKENFSVALLEEQIENYDEREKFWISFYNSKTPNGYNISPGGRGNGSGFENCKSIFSQKQIDEIVNLISNTKTSFEKISIMYDCALHTISQINLGKTYFNNNLSYPLRKSRYQKDLIKKIIYSLQYELNKSMNEIAKEYNIDPSQLNEINQGRVHAVKNKKYPLRENRPFSINKQYVNEIKDMLKNSDIAQKDISRKFNVSTSFVSAINKGIYYRDDDIQYPIRDNYQGKITSSKTFSNDELSEIERMLKNKISIEKISKLFECSKQTIMNINNGAIIQYRKNNIKYPIRKIK